jgi:acyl dehydratase
MTAFEIRRAFSRIDLALFSAATWNPHLIHLAPDDAARDALPGVVVQSHFLPAALLAAIDQNPSPTGIPKIEGYRLTGISWRNRKPVLAGQEVLYAVRTADSGSIHWTGTVQGGIVAEGTFSLRSSSAE